MEIIDSGIGKLIRPPDLDAFREWNRQKPKGLIDKRMTEADAVSQFVHDGDYIGTELYGTVRCPMSLVYEIIRQGKKDLIVAGQGVLELDMLLTAGLVGALDLTYIGLEVYGVSNPLRREVESGRIETCVDWSNAAMAWRFKATAMGVPFVPVRSMLGTDTLKYSAAKVVKDPFTGDPVCLVPALILDVGLIHVHRADKFGNCPDRRHQRLCRRDGALLQALDHQRRGDRRHRSDPQPPQPHHHPLLPGRRRRRSALRIAPWRDVLCVPAG